MLRTHDAKRIQCHVNRAALAAYREQYGWSYRDMATVCDVPHSVLWCMENVGTCSRRTLSKVAAALNVSENELRMRSKS